MEVPWQIFQMHLIDRNPHIIEIRACRIGAGEDGIARRARWHPRGGTRTSRTTTGGEAVRAEQAHRTFCLTIAHEGEGFELDVRRLADGRETALIGRQLGVDFQRGVDRHQREERLAGLHHRAR